MCSMPPCRKPAVTSRHHWPAAMAGPNLAPNAIRVPPSIPQKPPPVSALMLYSALTRNSPKLASRMTMVLNRACGISPPSRSAGLRRSIARAPTRSSQYGQTLSLTVINARQCGHIRRESIRVYGKPKWGRSRPANTERGSSPRSDRRHKPIVRPTSGLVSVQFLQPLAFQTLVSAEADAGEFLRRAARPRDGQARGGIARSQTEGERQLGLRQVAGAGLDHARLGSFGRGRAHHGADAIPVGLLADKTNA